MSTPPNHTGLAATPRAGLTTTTLDDSQELRQLATVTACDPTPSRNLRSCLTWSTSGCFFTVPQQQPRQTVNLLESDT
ncbi:hypothetical protein [Saccharothrix sp. Mg75]|uniref:hypothetical protein n=1 Tax=Saccharothrix sp. Mg75 TaxID=3445357 RepID=UPI003EEE6EF8